MKLYESCAHEFLLLTVIRFSLGRIYDDRHYPKHARRTWKYESASDEKERGRERKEICKTSEFWARWTRVPNFLQTLEDLARVGSDQVAETPTTTPVNAIEQFANCALRNYSPRQTYIGKKGRSVSGLDVEISTSTTFTLRKHRRGTVFLNILITTGPSVNNFIENAKICFL